MVFLKGVCKDVYKGVRNRARKGVRKPFVGELSNKIAKIAQNNQTIQNIQNKNYGKLIYYKIKFEMFENFHFSKTSQNFECILALLVYFVL